MSTGPKCDGCILHKLGKGFTQVETGSRYHSTRLLIVGEASGDAESRDSLPFRPYAQSGSLLADALRECAISRNEVAITNVVRCHPPGDVLEGAWYGAGAIDTCTSRYLSGVVRDLRPKVILALGGTALRTLAATPAGKAGTLDLLQGYVIPGAGVAQGIPVISAYHPAFIRRGASHLTPLLQRALKRAFLIATGKLIEGKHFQLIPRTNYQTPTEREAWAWFKSIDPERPIYADIETPRSGREGEDERNSFADRDILSIQFTQRRGEAIALPWRDDFISVARATLENNCRKVGHNWWGFDLPVLHANHVRVNGIQDDTMIMWKHYHADLPANLQAVAGFCGFPFPWKHLNESNPEFYGCADVDATAWADETLMALLKREGRFDSYERYFRDYWGVLRGMSVRGIPVNNQKRLLLANTIEVESIRVNGEVKALVPEEVLNSKQKYGYKLPPILKCDEDGCDFKGRGDHHCDPIGELVAYRDLAEAAGLVQREVVVPEDTKCRCTKATRAVCDVCGGSGEIKAGTKEIRWAALTEFNPNSAPQVKRFIKFLKHPIPKHAKRVDQSGEAAETTEVKELERLYARTRHPIYPLLIQKRQLTKVQGTYVDGWAPSRDGRLHTTFTFQPATWQTSSRDPNVQNGLKHGKTPFQKALAKGFNGMIEAEPGHKLVNVDAKSFHAQTTACEFGLPDYLRLAKIDIHSFVTCHYLRLPERIGLYERADEEMKEIFKFLKKDETFKFTRDYKAKRTILGIQFAMFYRKLYQLNPEDFENEAEAKKLWELIMIDLFPGLKRGQDRQRALAKEQGFLDSRYGARRRFYDVERWDRNKQKMVGGDQAEAAVAFCPAANAFGYMRDASLRIEEKGWAEKFQQINSIHDSLVFHCPDEFVEECVHVIPLELSKPASQMVFHGVTGPEGLSVEAEPSVGLNQAEMEEVK